MEDTEKTKAYRNGGKVFKEVYSSDRMEELKQIIEKIQSSGRNKIIYRTGAYQLPITIFEHKTASLTNGLDV